MDAEISPLPALCGNTLAQLARGVFGEGDGEDFVGAGVPAGDEIDDPVNEHGGLAGARTGDDEHRSVNVFDSFLLLRIGREGQDNSPLKLRIIFARAVDVQGGRGLRKGSRTAVALQEQQPSKVVPAVPVKLEQRRCLSLPRQSKLFLPKALQGGIKGMVAVLLDVERQIQSMDQKCLYFPR